MLSHFITFATLVTNAATKEIKFRALSLHQPEIELGVRGPKGVVESFKVYAHTLSSEKTITTREGRISLLSVEKNSAGKINWKPFTCVEIPSAQSSVILIISGDNAAPQATVVADPLERALGGSLRLFNTCPYAVGISLPGFKKILARGTETFYLPNLSQETYGQGQFFTANLGGGWRAAGGIRWLQLNDTRTLWFIAPDPNNSNLVTVRGIEERVRSSTNVATLKVNPKNTVSQSTP